MEAELYSVNNLTKDILFEEAVLLLKNLIAVPSFSGQEELCVKVLTDFLDKKNIAYTTKFNNIICKNLHFHPRRKSILLNSHIDTVQPAVSYTRDPFFPHVEDGKLFGLGSNDAGGCLVSLLEAFLYFYNDKDLPFNLIFAATAEEEISGSNGIESILPQLGEIEFAIIGEPTLMNLAIAEKGLLVVDCIARGISGHAARNEGKNAIYEAIRDIEWIRSFRFPKISDQLGEVKMSVTSVSSLNQHNIVPSECKFTIDIRVNELYRNEDILELLKKNISSEIRPRSMRLQPSGVDPHHPFITAGTMTGMRTYGSPTTSDQSVIPFTSVKLGPGDSARSHTADEFIYLDQIKDGIGKYIGYLTAIFNSSHSK